MKALDDELLDIVHAQPAMKNDRVEELGVFGAKTGEMGTVLAADMNMALVRWDDDGRELLRQMYIQKLYSAQA